MARAAPFDNYYELYEKWFEDNRFTYLSELKAVRHFIPTDKKGIEIGSGSGRFALPFSTPLHFESEQHCELQERRKNEMLLLAKTGIDKKSGGNTERK